MLDIRNTAFARQMMAVVPAILVVGLTLFLVLSRPNDVARVSGSLPGTPLFFMEDLYPVKVDGTGTVVLDLGKFVKALNDIEQRNSPRALAELIYFGQTNNLLLMLNDKERKQYSDLLTKYPYAEDVNNQYSNQYLQSYRDIVNGLGQTFAGTGIELVLHDMRNPLKSVVAIQNPISGRRVGDPTTNFGVQMIKSFSVAGARLPSMISYGLKLKDGRDVKSSTVPIYDPVYGLIAALCINIDITKLDPSTNPADVARFLMHFRAVDPNEPISEMIESSRVVIPKE